MDKDRLLHLLDNERAGSLSAKEAEELDAWYRSAESAPGFTDGLSAAGLSAMEERLLARIQSEILPPAAPVMPLMPRRAWPSWGSMAVAVILLLVTSIGIYQLVWQNGRVVEKTGFGETRLLKLPDGSEVTLNGNSELSYNRKWNDSREVYLEGEAYFQVVHTSDHRKFRVRTGDDFSVDVLGTQFNVSKRKSGTRIVLDEGKVRCNLDASGQDTLVLRPGEMVQFVQKPSEYRRERVEKGLYSAWKEHKLVFKNTSLEEVAAILQDTYGLAVETTLSELLQRRISGSVPTDNVDLLLQGIAEASDVTITRDGDQLVMSPKPE